MADKTTKNNTTATMSTCNALMSGIVQCHNDNNIKAMSLDDLDDTVTEQALNQWIVYTEMLRQTVMPYVELTMQKDAQKAAITKAKGAVFAAWKDVLTDAMGKKYSKNWFVREDDTAWLLRAVVRNTRTANGSAYSFKPKTEFRREVERLIGCRIASNAILTDEKADVIRKYESALRTEEACNKRLHEGDKNHMSLEAQLEAAQNTLIEKTEEFKTIIEEHPELEGALLASYVKDVKETKEMISRTKKTLAQALTDKADLGKQYKEIMAEVAKIEA